jgi:hypothetical protein
VRVARVAAATVGGIAAVTLLTGCQRPVPYVTIETGHGSIRVPPQKWCYNPPNDCAKIGSSDLQTIKVPAGGTLLVDVPADVAQQRWLVDSYVEQNGKQQVIPDASSGLVADRHSTRVGVPAAFAGEQYILSVQSTNGANPTGVWGVLVEVTS